MGNGSTSPDGSAGGIPGDESSNWEDLSRIIHKFTPNEPLEGEIIGSEPFNEGKYAGKSLKWYLEQLDGIRVSFVAGESFDKLMSLRRLAPGDYVRVTLLGQKVLPDGRKCNEWQILRRKSKPMAEPRSETPF